MHENARSSPGAGTAASVQRLPSPSKAVPLEGLRGRGAVGGSGVHPATPTAPPTGPFWKRDQMH